MTEGFQCNAKHLLWTIHFISSHNPNHDEVAVFLNTNYKTLKLHVEYHLLCLYNALPHVCLHLYANRLIVIIDCY